MTKIYALNDGSSLKEEMAKESSHGALLPWGQFPLIHQNILGQEHPSKICKTKIHVEKTFNCTKKGV